MLHPFPSTASTALLVTCEHGGNSVPRAYHELFARKQRLLQSHRGYDPGALGLARMMSARLEAELVMATTTRLLVDLNRHPSNPTVFSPITSRLPENERQHLLRRYHAPYRERSQHWVRRQTLAGRRVVHVSCHSFTPRLHGETRTADIGLLYDPRHDQEVALANAWRAAILSRADLRVRRNYPYLGTADALTTHLRKRFRDEGYAGIEVEVNQRFPLHQPDQWRTLRSLLCETLAEALRRGPSTRSA
jgi:predicted N-formylglutamate amidohydrolase